jgi:two-component system, sensor histidine kinase and response regulator
MTIPSSPRQFDISDMRRRLGNNDALIADVLRMFIEIHPQQMAGLSSAIGSGRADAVRSSAHSLKGCAGNLSAAGVVQASAALERAAERGETGDFERLFHRVRDEMALLVDELTVLPEQN